MQLAEYTAQQIRTREKTMQKAYEQSLFPRENDGETERYQDEDWRCIWEG